MTEKHKRIFKIDYEAKPNELDTEDLIKELLFKIILNSR